jgi:hypothetical protein
MDFITGLPAYKNKRRDADFDAILVIMNKYSKMLRYIPCHKTITALQLAERL